MRIEPVNLGLARNAPPYARFVLDAMPGKQMAIDAELRSGSIDGIEARRRRRALSRESQFYGSMDGAMKFVKGNVRLCPAWRGGGARSTVRVQEMTER